jgi:hypothetical protein
MADELTNVSWRTSTESSRKPSARLASCMRRKQPPKSSPGSGMAMVPRMATELGGVMRSSKLASCG